MYDIIILIGGLHHVPDYAETVCSNLSKSLKKGGYFINFEPTNNNIFVRCIRNLIYKKNHIFDECTERAFSLSRYNSMFINSGLTIYRQFFPGLLGYVLYYNPDAFPFLNKGTTITVDRIFDKECKYYASRFGRWMSFCTFSIFRKE